MIWGVTLQPGEDYTAVLPEEVRLSMASIECRASKTAVPCPVSHVVMTTVKGEFLLCSLEKGPTPQQNLDLVLQPREQVTFTVEGTGAVHLTGYTPEKSLIVHASSSNDEDQEMNYVPGEGSDEPDSGRPYKEKGPRSKCKDEPDGRHGNQGEESKKNVGNHEETHDLPKEGASVKTWKDFPSAANGYGGWLAEEGFNPDNVPMKDEFLLDRIDNRDVGSIQDLNRNHIEESFIARPTPINHRKQLLSPQQGLVNQAKGVFQKLKEMPHQCSYCFEEFSSLSLCRHHEQTHEQMNTQTHTETYTPTGIDFQSPLNKVKRPTGRVSRLDAVVNRITEKKQNGFAATAEVTGGGKQCTLGRPLSCKYCNKTFSRHDSMMAHQRLHSLEYVVKETTKSTKRANENNLGSGGSVADSNVIANDGIPRNVASSGGIHFCRYCNKPFSSKSKLTIHERKHTGERPFKCKHCFRAFAAMGDCRRHEQLHTDEGQSNLPRCRHCSKPFYSVSKCLIHERIHTGEKPYQCRMCDNTFSQKGHLTTHERTHTGERPYRCQYCNRGFSTGSGRKKHEKLHRKGGAKLKPVPVEDEIMNG